MAEIRQANFRLDQAAADNFRKFCEDNGYSQAEGFDYLMQLLSMSKTMKAAPSRKTEIESFKKSIEAITQTYLASVDLCTDTEARIRSQYDAALASKDATIADLQAAREQAASAAEESARAAAQAVKDASTAQRQAETAERLCNEKDRTIVSLKEKVVDYNDLKKSYGEVQKKLAEMGEEVTELRRSAEKQKRDAEMDLERAVMEKEREYMDKLRETEAAKAADITELTEAHREEVARIHAKLDERAEALMHARQQASEAVLALEREKVKVAELEQQLKQLKDTLAKSKQ